MGFVVGESIPTRMRCHVCNRVSPVGFWVPNELWRIAVPEQYRESVVCVPCFACFADERLLAWDKEIRFYPESLRTHLEGCRNMSICEPTDAEES